MNDTNLQQIFANYIDNFAMMNGSEHREYFKWISAKYFKEKMDKALYESPLEDLPAELTALKKLSGKLIDNRVQPFQGLSKYAEKEPETVRDMLRDLFAEDGGDVRKIQEKVSVFLKRSHELRDKYFHDSFMYKDDVHSVTGYLFLYDPDHNFIFKSTQAQIFADCVEFYSDWGSGDNVKLEVYYQMCNQLVEAIKKSKELLATDKSRFEAGIVVEPDKLHRDPEKHILAFDIIWCCSTYDLYKGMSFKRPKTKERQLMAELKRKAADTYEKLLAAQNDANRLKEAKVYINDVFSEGKSLKHKKYGDGIIKANSQTVLTVDFSGEEKQLGTIVSVLNGFISSSEEGFAEKLEEYRDVLKKDESIRLGLAAAEKAFAPYSEYLD